MPRTNADVARRALSSETRAAFDRGARPLPIDSFEDDIVPEPMDEEPTAEQSPCISAYFGLDKATRAAILQGSEEAIAEWQAAVEAEA